MVLQNHPQEQLPACVAAAWLAGVGVGRPLPSVVVAPAAGRRGTASTASINRATVLARQQRAENARRAPAALLVAGGAKARK